LNCKSYRVCGGGERPPEAVSAGFTGCLAVISPPWPGREEQAVTEIDDLVTVSIKYIMGMRAIV
jgi:hypothetical protein